MDNIKIAVTVLGIPGRTRHRVGEVKKVTLYRRKDLFPKKRFPEEIGNQVVKKVVRRIPVEEYIPCSQHLNLSQEAYDYMVSTEVPSWGNPKTWKRLSKEERLKAHMQRIQEHLRGTSVTYTVFED